MNILQNGVLTVVGATLLASVLIIFTGNNDTTAEIDSASLTEKVKGSGADQLNSKPLTSTSAVLSKIAPIENNLNAENSQQKQGHNKHPIISPILAPPIGPFQVAQPDGFGFLGVPKNTSKTNNVSVTPAIKKHAPNKMQRYMYVPVPMPMFKQVPRLPTMGNFNSSAPYKNKQQPKLQPNKE